MKKATPQIRQRIVELREAGGKPSRPSRIRAAIATEFGVTLSKQYIEWICIEECAEPPHLAAKPVTPRARVAYQRGDITVVPVTPEQDARMLELRGSGLSVTKIAEQLGRKPSTVRHRLFLLARQQERADCARETRP